MASIQTPIVTPTTKHDIDPPRLLLRSTEAAQRLALSPRKLWSLTASRQIPCVRVGRCVRYDPRDLQTWVDQQKGGRG